MPHQERSKEVQESIDNCQSCHTICIETIEHCLEMGGKHADASHIRLLADCVQMCQTSADFMIRDSDYYPKTCGVCAEICEACAESCESLATGEGADIMRRCADICRRCAESCRRMAAKAGKPASV